jgi:hypothetical protein
MKNGSQLSLKTTERVAVATDVRSAAVKKISKEVKAVEN